MDLKLDYEKAKAKIEELLQKVDEITQDKDLDEAKIDALEVSESALKERIAELEAESVEHKTEIDKFCELKTDYEQQKT